MKLVANNWLGVFFCLVVWYTIIGHKAPAVCDDKIDFERQIAPLLIARCLECHHEHVAAGEIVLSNKESVFRAIDGEYLIAPGRPAHSRLLSKIVAGEMPPAKKGTSQNLSAEDITILSNWISQGAFWPSGRDLDPYELTTDQRAGRDWWSLQPVRRPELPQNASTTDFIPANAIDVFVLARATERGLVSAPLADPETLIRRVYYDLTGLPPSVQEVESFIANRSPDAWLRLVDRLLASPQYGQRWGRYWLDVVRYADTCGYERDQEKPFAWKYRDWVVSALNSDMPYDQFVREQIAGDEIPKRTLDSVVATGFLRLGTWNDEPNDPEDYKFERLEDMVHATSAAFLGLTVKCARCHDHKFDPIPQTDYYRMAAAFWAGPIDARGRELLGGPTSQELGVPDVLGWTDLVTEPRPLHLLKGGERHKPLQPVSFRAISVMPALDVAFQSAAIGARTSGRRLQLAHWITRYDNPLTSRVLVNRLWQNHFGEGLVRSPNNFGFTGAKPTHPELLDWLSAELLDNSWHTKTLHRQILMSRTYRQASEHPRFTEFAERDFDNRYLWRAQRRRLDAEALRDSLLSASGELDMRIGGPGFRPTISEDALEGLSRKTAAWKPSPVTEQARRSIYQFSQRSLLPPMMTTFDFGDTTLPCERRDVTTVAPQALALLNDPFVHERSIALAGRFAVDDQPWNIRESIGKIWSTILGRYPNSREITLAEEHLMRQKTRLGKLSDAQRQGHSEKLLALASLCTVLFNSNEFIYVD